MAKAGRPAKDFDRELFEQLCAIMCTEEEICSIFETTDKTLVNWCQRTYGMNFSEAQKRYSARGKMSLRRYQFKLAQKSAAMAIFLGKNYLGQKDNIIEIKTISVKKIVSSKQMNRHCKQLARHL